MKKLCIYHKRCIDGFAAAWVVGRYFGYDNVEFLAQDYDDPIPNLTGRDVYIVDFSYGSKEMMPLLDTVKQVTIIDHHKKAIDDWTNVEHPKLRLLFSKLHSGAALSWKYFYPDTALPNVFATLQDHDLWQFKKNATRETVAALYAKGFVLREDFKAFDEYVYGAINWGDLYKEGKAILEAQEVFIHNLLERNVQLVRFMGHTIPIAAVPYDYASRACEILYERGYPFAMTYEDWGSKGIRKFSMRSKKGVGLDVDHLARLLGGGGHENAAGFSVDLKADLSTYLVFQPAQG